MDNSPSVTGAGVGAGGSVVREDETIRREKRGGVKQTIGEGIVFNIFL